MPMQNYLIIPCKQIALILLLHKMVFCCLVGMGAVRIILILYLDTLQIEQFNLKHKDHLMNLSERYFLLQKVM